MDDYLFALEDRRQVAEDTMAFRFDTTGSGFTFEAGQNADFTLIDPPSTDAEGDARTFSLASSPRHRDFFLVATRMRKTAFKNSLASIPLGTKVEVSGPNGNMVLPEDTTSPAVLLAGGIGITPFRSMIEWTAEERLQRPLYLFYSNRTRAAAAFLQDLEEWEKKSPALRLIPTVTDAPEPGWRYETGRVDEAMLRKYVSDLQGPTYFIAGPPGMVSGTRRLLTDLGVKRDRIELETFSGY